MKQLIKCCGGCIANLLWVTVLVAQPNISRIEYYLDNDPGYDNGISVSFAADTNLSNLTFNLDPLSLTAGVHLLGVRAKDENGAWSHDNKWLFAKPYPSDTTKAATAPLLKQVEYYIDKDPGYGKGVPVAIGKANNLADISLAVNVSGLTTGNHNLFIRSKDVNNGWSLDNVLAFNTGAVIPPPSIIVNSIVRKTLCQQDSVDVSYQATGSYRPGNIFNVELSDTTGSFGSPIAIGSFTGTGNSIIKCGLPSGLPASTQYKIRINSTNPAVTGLPGDSIKINNPSPVITPSDTVLIKQGDSIKLTTTSGYSGYLWSTTATTPGIQVKEFGSYSVKVTDNNGCSAISAPVWVYVIPAITTSGPVSNVCPGSSVTLTSSAANNYLWNTADTTQSIIATAAGSYYVVVNGGGTGNVSAPVNVTYKGCGNPGSLSATNITDTTATLNWGKVACAKFYQLHYRLSGTTKWSILLISNPGTSYGLTGLSASTTYQWQVRAVCADSPLLIGKYSSIDSFTTSAAAGIAARAFPAQALSRFSAVLFPNPTTHRAILQVTGSTTKITVLITDIAGKVLWQRDKINSNTSLPVEDFSAGTYLVIIKDANNRETLKLVKN